MTVQITITDRHDKRHVHTKISVDGTQTFTVEDTHVVVADVTGADPLKSYSGGKPWRPDMIRMEYHRKNGGEWRSATPRLSGWYIKKNGSDSQQDTSTALWGDLPEWVCQFIEANAPVAD